MKSRALTQKETEQLSPSDQRLLDQFAYRYTRLQDDMGNRLFPAILRALGEDVSVMPALDRFARLEQIGWLPNAEDWGVLRQIRNQFTHDDPDSARERFERLEAATKAAYQLVAILAHMDAHVRRRFAGSDLF